MKFSLLSIALLFSFFSVKAQADKVSTLAAGTYAIQTNNVPNWAHGDIILIDDNHYKTSTDNVTGDYKFSATAQRILFLSGPLKGAFAKTVMNAGNTAIILPLKENVELGFKLANMDVWAYYKKN